MITAKNKFRSFILFILLLASAGSFGYPIWIKIENPRAHTLYAVSKSEGMTIEIPAGSYREFKVAGPNDFRVRYTSGVYHTAQVFLLDKELNHFVDKCISSMADNWHKKTIKYCVLRLDNEIGASFVAPAYTLTVTEIKDLEIAYDHDTCKLNPNENAFRLIPCSREFTLVPPDLFEKAKALFRLPK